MRITIWCFATMISLASWPGIGQEAPDKSMRGEIHRGAGDRIEILLPSGPPLYREEGKKRHLTVERTAWTADSRFFVWSGVDAAGHQPWHHPIFIWSRNSGKVIGLEDYLPGMIDDADFSLSAPAIVEGRTRRDLDSVPVPFRLDLNLLPATQGRLAALRRALARISEPERSGVLAEIGLMWADLNDADDALRVASWMAPHRDGERVIIAAAAARASCGAVRRGIALSARLTDPGDQAEALLRIAKIVREQGDRGQVWSLLRKALPLAVRAGPDDRRDDLLGLAAEMDAALGNYSKVRQTVALVADPASRAVALARAAWAFLRWRTDVRGMENEPPVLAAAIEDPEHRANAFTRLITIPVGDLDSEGNAAVDAAERIERPVAREAALGRIAAALAAADRIVQADQVARRITTKQQHDWAQVDLVEAMARQGDLSAARRRAAAIADRGAQSEALLAILRLTAERGDIVAADALVNEMTGRQRDSAAAILAVAAARGGHPERANALATGIADPGRRAVALAAGATPVTPCGMAD